MPANLAFPFLLGGAQAGITAALGMSQNKALARAANAEARAISEAKIDELQQRSEQFAQTRGALTARFGSSGQSPAGSASRNTREITQVIAGDAAIDALNIKRNARLKMEELKARVASESRNPILEGASAGLSGFSSGLNIMTSLKTLGH